MPQISCYVVGTKITAFNSSDVVRGRLVTGDIVAGTRTVRTMYILRTSQELTHATPLLIRVVLGTRPDDESRVPEATFIS